MPTQSKTLTGLYLENFLLDLSEMLLGSVYEGNDPATIFKLRLWMIEIGRYHLAGFSETQIRGECSPPSTNTKVIDVLYSTVVNAIGDVTMADPETGEKMIPRVGELNSLLNLRGEYSIDQLRMVALAKPIMAFTEGDYESCARVSSYGASAFGRHLFYQLNIIANFRRGQHDIAKRAGCAAQNALQSSPWHHQLARLTLGETTSADLLSQVKDDGMRFQVSCFEGFRAFTNGDKATAKRLLTEAGNIPNNLILERSMVGADLSRC